MPEAEDAVTAEDETEESSESESDEKPAEVTTEAEEPESTAEDEASDAGEPETTNGKLGNRRPSGRTAPRRRRRLRGGVAVED